MTEARIEVTEGAVKVLLSCAHEYLDTNGRNENTAALAAAVKQCNDILDTPPEARAQSLFDGGMVNAIGGVLNDAYGYLEDAGDAELCARTNAISDAIRDAHAAHSEWDAHRNDIGHAHAVMNDPRACRFCKVDTSLFEAISKGDNDKADELIEAARKGAIIRLT